MIKYCPFCDSELSETLWCEQCRRYAILYNTHGAAVEDTCDDNETERKELYRRLTAALKNLYAAKSKPTASAPASRPVFSAVPEDSGKNPGKDTPKIILLGSMLSVCFILCLVVCAHLVLKRGTEPSGGDRATRADTQSRHDAGRASESVEEPAEIILIPPEPPVESDNETSVQPADEASVPDETLTQPADEASIPDETSAHPADEASPEADAAEIDWKLLEQLDPLDLQIYGDTKYYYYAAEDIEALGLQCTYYHLGIAYDEAANAVKDFFGEAASEEEPYDNTYYNSYADSGYEYYTSFQQILSYDCGGLRCSVNYDTGSGIVHFISFYGANIDDYADLIQELSALASPEYNLSVEALRESILSTEDVLLHLDPPDMWHEEYVYQDSCISLSMTCSDGTYDLQITSRKYADDVVQNTLSISRPK
ncbi:MAG: hypothetical protein K2J60_01715 [Acetatifactor sp.]|nr:hypothetical protein [Acetatifactor sp.]